jgi:hypothetical protein
MLWRVAHLQIWAFGNWLQVGKCLAPPISAVHRIDLVASGDIDENDCRPSEAPEPGSETLCICLQ